MPLQPGLIMRYHAVMTALAVALTLTATPVHGEDVYWTNPEGGFWSPGAPLFRPSNWSNGSVPDSLDTAVFGLGASSPGYAVTFNANPTHAAVRIPDDHLMFNMNDATHTLTDTDISLSIASSSPSDLSSLTMFAGTIDAAASVDIAGSGAGALFVNVDANLNVGTGDSEAGILLNPNGLLVIENGGSVTTPHLFDLGGIVEFRNGALDITHGDLFIQSDSPFGNSLNIPKHSQVSVGSLLSVDPDSALLVTGGQVSATTLKNLGAFVATSGNVIANTLILSAGSTTDLFADTTTAITGGMLDIRTNADMTANGILSTSQLRNNGEFASLRGVVSVAGPASNSPIARITAIDATINFPGDGVANSVGLLNHGTLTLAGTTINGDVHSTLGSRIDVASNVIFNGLVSGFAIFPGAGIVTFNGGYAPGDGPLFIRFTGPLAMGSDNSLLMDVATPSDLTTSIVSEEVPDPAPGIDFDQIEVTSPTGVNLSGSLIIQPDPLIRERHVLGTLYPILLYTTRAGTMFDEIQGTLIDTNLALAPVVGDTDITLRLSIPGDLNFDNKVSISDLSELALNLNTTPGAASWHLGDFNGDNRVTLADLSLLALNFGFDLTSGLFAEPITLTEAAMLAGIDLSVIPEPSTIFLVVSSLGFCANSRRIRPNRRY